MTKQTTNNDRPAIDLSDDPEARLDLARQSAGLIEAYAERIKEVAVELDTLLK